MRERKKNNKRKEKKKESINVGKSGINKVGCENLMKFLIECRNYVHSSLKGEIVFCFVEIAIGLLKKMSTEWSGGEREETG